MLKRLSSLALLLVLALACGSGRIVASAFDQGCNADADCVAVRVGDPCACEEQWDGIARSEQARYDERARGVYSSAARAACSSCRESPETKAKAICSARKCTAVVAR